MQQMRADQIFNFKMLNIIIFNILILFFDLIKVPNTPRKVIDGNSNPSLSIDNSEIGI